MTEFYEPPGRPRVSVGCGIAIGLAVGILGTIVVAYVRSSTRADNQRAANGFLKVITNAEAEFRTKDLDGNGVQDFWTGDVAGLHRYGGIDRELAQADAEPLQALTPNPIPCKGYLFRALDTDESDFGALYRQDTDKKAGNVHHRHKFGFVAYPAEPGRAGKYIYIINENCTILHRSAEDGPPPKSWPSDEDLKKFWWKE